MATVGVYINAGSRYESPETNGTAHFLEHMAFKGTAKRSQFELEKEIEDMGAHLNAYTSREHTVYFAQVFPKHVSNAVEILSDILQNSTLDPGAVERERDVILRESEEVDLQHQEMVFDKLHQMAFRGTSMAQTIIGPEVNVETLEPDALRTFVRTHYTTDRVVVVGTGAVNHDDLCKLVSSHFNKLESKTPEGLKVSNGGKPYFTGSDIRMREDDMDKAHVAFAFEVVPWSHADALTMSVIVCLLGVHQRGYSSENSAGKLSRVVAADDLADQVMPFYTPYVDTGLFGVYYVASPYKLPELSWAVQEEVTRLCYEVDEQDVRRAVNQVKSNLAYCLDGSQTINEEVGRQMLTLGRRMSLKESFDRLDLITATDIKRVANEYFYDKDLVVSAIGPISKLPDYNRFRRRTYWLRY
eukprot:c10998_g1_i1.p1 GENE.c10998_g1_i1~~c10998_g1_i1.p1  ORF type:complete len:414 (+),score=82.89 c10998_g1_i1:335-1576(+)